MKEFFTYTTPEKAGISSKSVIKFMSELERFGIYLHSFALIKGNEIFAEAYRKPFKKDEPHRLYSASKTFASMALGILIGEGKVSLSDKVLKYFPEYDAQTTDPYVRNMTIEHMLKMSTCFTYPTTYGAKRASYLEPDWVKTFFTVDSSHPSGTVYNYDTSASYMCGVIVERITRLPFIEYLKQKVLLKIGGSPITKCLKAPEGYAWGGSAVIAPMLDLARLARLVMLDGEWDGEQLLPRDYVIAAKSNQTDNCKSGFKETYSGHGYGYQIWRTVGNTYSFIGMGQQLAICMPDEDLLFVCTADCQGYNAAHHIIFVNLFRDIKDKISDNSLPEDTEAYNELIKLCESLEYPIFEGNKTSKISDYICGKTFKLSDNKMGISEICFEYDGDNGIMKYTNAQGYKELKFGIGKSVISEFPQDGYFGDTIGKDGKRRYRCIASGAWTNEFTLHIKCDLIDEYFGNLSIIASFDGDKIGLYMEPHAEWFLEEYSGFAGGVSE